MMQQVLKCSRPGQNARIELTTTGSGRAKSCPAGREDLCLGGSNKMPWRGQRILSLPRPGVQSYPGHLEPFMTLARRGSRAGA